MTHKYSILISSHNRLELLTRSLWYVSRNPPPGSYEVVLADDGSTDDIIGLLDKFSSVFPWKFVRIDKKIFEEKTGIKPYFNNPAHTNNAAFRYAEGDYVYLMGNGMIPWQNCLSQLAEEVTESNLVFSTTYDLPLLLVDRLDTYGSNLTKSMMWNCCRWPLLSGQYHSDVTNYLSLCHSSTWGSIGGYDERYLAGISSDDSDFVRRIRARGYKTKISEAISLHQNHGGKTRFYDPDPSVITQERWDEGVKINHDIFDSWDGSYHNPCPWPVGVYGVVEVVDSLRRKR